MFMKILVQGTFTAGTRLKKKHDKYAERLRAEEKNEADFTPTLKINSHLSTCVFKNNFNVPGNK